MTPEERDRLRTLEVQQAAIQKDVSQIAKDISDIKTAYARAGGVIFGASLVAGFFGWLIAKGNTFFSKIGIG